MVCCVVMVYEQKVSSVLSRLEPLAIHYCRFTTKGEQTMRMYCMCLAY